MGLSNNQALKFATKFMLLPTIVLKLDKMHHLVRKLKQNKLMNLNLKVKYENKNEKACK